MPSGGVGSIAFLVRTSRAITTLILWLTLTWTLQELSWMALGTEELGTCSSLLVLSARGLGDSHPSLTHGSLWLSSGACPGGGQKAGPWIGLLD